MWSFYPPPPKRDPCDYSRGRCRAFTLVELIAVIAIAAILATVAMVYIVGAVQAARTTAEKGTLSVLNDTLNRYKCEGGDISALTSGAPIKNVLAKLAGTINWNGFYHTVMSKATTYQAKSLSAQGDQKTYRFYRYNTYNAFSDGADTPIYKYGYGVGYMAHASSSIAVTITTASTSYFAVKDASNATTIYVAGSSQTLPESTSYTFWACAGVADSTAAGSITGFSCTTGNNLTALDLSGLTEITSIACTSNGLTSFTSLSFSGLKKLTTLNIGSLHYLGAVDVSNCTALQTINALGCDYAMYNTSFTLTNCTALSSFTIAYTQTDNSKSHLEGLFSRLPTVALGRLRVRANAMSYGCDTTVAAAKGWVLESIGY